MKYKKCPKCNRDLACVDTNVQTFGSGHVDKDGYMLVGRIEEELEYVTCGDCGARLDALVKSWDWGADVD